MRNLKFHVLWLLQVLLFPASVVEGRTVRRNDERIIGGRDALPGEFPYQVSIGFILPETNLYQHFCGGSILDERHVLTAGHCGLRYKQWVNRSRRADLDDIFERDGPEHLSRSYVVCSDHFVQKDFRNKNLLSQGLLQGEWFVVAGALNITDLTESTRVELPVAQVYMHEDFNMSLIKDDVTLIRVRGEFPLDGPAIWTIPIRNVTLDPPAECTVSGWGRYSSLPLQSEVLQALEQPLISTEECARCYEDFYIHVLPGELCSGFLDGGRSACHGDSGGPLVCGGQLTGVTSWSGGCATPNNPVVFADVAYFKDWIQNTLAKSYEDEGF